jgi:hypothetical protein
MYKEAAPSSSLRKCLLALEKHLGVENYKLGSAQQSWEAMRQCYILQGRQVWNKNAPSEMSGMVYWVQRWEQLKHSGGSLPMSPLHPTAEQEADWSLNLGNT